VFAKEWGVVPFYRKHLQEIPDQSSNVSTSFTWGWDSSKTSELLSGMGVSALEKEEVDSENIPQELLSNLGLPQSPPRKRLKSKGNDKDFVIIRRPKLNRENYPGRYEGQTVIYVRDGLHCFVFCFLGFFWGGGGLWDGPLVKLPHSKVILL
jgi:hypothetical protein